MLHLKITIFTAIKSCSLLLKHVIVMHTCDTFKKGIREVFFSSQGGFSKCIEYMGKLFIHFREFHNFVKIGMF